MPIYEYQCDACEHKFERLQKISDEPLKDCPDCGKESLRKLISAAAFRLSGSGWYETDFKDKKQQKNLSSSDNKKPDGGESKKPADSKKSESTSPTKPKPESKTSSSTSSGGD